jgi:hypothetical protein
VNEKYASGNYDDAFMRDYIRMKFQVSEITEGVQLADAYFKKLTPHERALPENWLLFGNSPVSNRIAYANSRNSNYLIDHWADFKGNIPDSALYAEISENFRTITSDAFNGNYFSNFGRNCTDFDTFKTRIKAVGGLPDKQDCLVMMDVAKAVCQNDTSRIESLLAEHVADFSAANQSILFDFFRFYLNSKKTEGTLYIMQKANRLMKRKSRLTNRYAGAYPLRKILRFSQKNYNFFCRNLKDSNEIQLTTDGEEQVSYQLANLKWISPPKVYCFWE